MHSGLPGLFLDTAQFQRNPHPEPYPLLTSSCCYGCEWRQSTCQRWRHVTSDGRLALYPSTTHFSSR